MVTSQGRVKVGDFGLSKVRNTMLSSVSSAVVGTCEWLAPESWVGQSGKPADVWGLGCVVLFLMTGKGPWDHLNSDRNAIYTALIREKKVPRPTSAVDEQCPADFARLQGACCAYAASDRPAIGAVVKSMRVIAQHVQDPGDFALPWHWLQRALNTRSPCRLIQMSDTDDDYARVEARLKAVIPTAAVTSIELNCNVDLYRMYFAQRQLVARRNGWDGEDGMELKAKSNERWLWHGVRDSHALPQLLTDGLSTQYSNLEFAFYGSGVYFAPDARLANAFARADGAGQRKLILARVACGKIADKASTLDPAVTGDAQWLNPTRNELDKQRLWQILRRPEHRRPPEGHQSIVGVDRRGARGREDRTELVRGCRCSCVLC